MCAVINVHDLEYTYPGTGNPAVRGVNFTIESGEIFGFLGPSGAGKSTTQKVLIGLLKGYKGRVQVFGRELAQWGQDYYEQVGVSFELPNHYLRLSALENLRYFAALYSGETEDPRRLLEQLGLADAADMPVAQFSKGMKARLNVARSLLNKPELLFLDEPTSGLDPVNARMVKELVLRKRAEGTTVFVTTHNMALADEFCDRVAFIVDGQISLIDAPASLKKQYGRRALSVEYRNGGPDNQTREFELDNLAGDQGFWQIIQHNRIESMHTQETTLEQIFIEVTGRELA
jgi:fluoroquinolone transport system ATP-binding protein